VRIHQAAFVSDRRSVCDLWWEIFSDELRHTKGDVMFERKHVYLLGTGVVLVIVTFLLFFLVWM
jgi:hypothetical protein